MRIILNISSQDYLHNSCHYPANWHAIRELLYAHLSSILNKRYSVLPLLRMALRRRPRRPNSDIARMAIGLDICIGCQATNNGLYERSGGLWWHMQIPEIPLQIACQLRQKKKELFFFFPIDGHFGCRYNYGMGSEFSNS